MLTMILMQGPSGGGKSTKAKELAPKYNAVIYSTDDFHMEDGVYVFKGHKLGEFHAANLKRTAEALKRGQSVIVDNTNLQNWQIKGYVLAADAAGAKIEIVRCDGGYQGVHGVPADKVAAMRANMEVLDPAIARNQY